MKKIKSAIIVILILAAVFIYAHIGKNNLVYDKAVDSSKYIATGAITNIEQRFVCMEKTLDGFRVKCQVLGDVQGMKIQYSLVNTITGETEAEGEADAIEMKNSKFYYFRFDTLENCEGNTYKVIFKNESAKEGQGIGFFYQQETEDGTSLSIQGNDTIGTMIVKAVTQRFDLETFVVLSAFVLYVAVFIKFLYKLFK